MTSRPRGAANPVRRLELAHAVLWGDVAYLVKVGLDHGGVARTVQVVELKASAARDLVKAGPRLTRALRTRSLGEVFKDPQHSTGAMGFLIRHAVAVERQAGPIVRYAFQLECRP